MSRGKSCTKLCTPIQCSGFCHDSFFQIYPTLFYFILLYCTLFYFILLYCTLFYFILLYCTLLYFILLYFTLQLHQRLSFTNWFTILFYNIVIAQNATNTHLVTKDYKIVPLTSLLGLLLAGRVVGGVCLVRLILVQQWKICTRENTAIGG
jgi:hypothetical protein